MELEFYLNIVEDSDVIDQSSILSLPTTLKLFVESSYSKIYLVVSSMVITFDFRTLTQGK